MIGHSWQTLGTYRPDELVEERLQLHWALQPLSAAAQAAIEHQPDDGHTAIAACRGLLGV